MNLSVKRCGVVPLGLLLCSAWIASAQSANPAARHKHQLVWSDEFDYTGQPDPSKWEFETDTGGWGNGEAEHYSSELDNARVEDGHLVIEARRESGHTYMYSSARLHSRQSFLYGHLEVRAKVPTGLGTWPAIWMMPVQQTYGDGLWPDNGEIDLMEHVGRAPGVYLANFYTKNFNWMLHTGKSEYFFPLNHFEDDYHIFALDWDSEEIALSVDGLLINVFKNPHTDWQDWPFNKEFHVILNLALGGFGGDIDDSVFPQQFLIDYVRLYQ